MIFKVKKENWRKTGVYCVTNLINNKIYIGSTSTNFRQRFLQHKSDYKKKKQKIPILHKAFDKYGYRNFAFSIMFICPKKDCIKMEQFYIDKGVDYNACLIAGSLLGFKHSEDSKTRTVIKGKHHCATKVDMYSLNGEFIKSFDSMTDAQECMGIKSKSNISQCCKGKVFSAGGFRWSYHNKELSNRIDKRTLPITEEKRKKMSRPRKKDFPVKGIIATNLFTNKKLFYKSIKEASVSLGILKTSIHNNISGISKSSRSKVNNQKYKFTWNKDTI